MKDTLKNFFFSDVFRILIIIILILALSLDIFVLKALSLMKKKFSLIFIILINIMIFSFLQGVAYLIDWVPDAVNSEELLFGESNSFICKFQSFTVGIFLEIRETFATLITIILFLKAIPKINIERNIKNISIIIAIGILPPLINNICLVSSGGYGRSHLFCFTTPDSKGTICATIHFVIIVVNVLISFILALILIFFIYFKSKKNSEEEDLEENISSREDINISILVKKIIIFPIAQILFMLLPIIYRTIEYRSSYVLEREKIVSIAGTVALNCTIPSLGYTIIFAISHNLFSVICQKDKEEIQDEKLNELTTNISEK